MAINHKKLEKICVQLEEIRNQIPFEHGTLDSACINQAILTDRIGEIAAYVSNLVKRAKDALERVHAKLFLDIKYAPEEFDLKKQNCTNDTIKARIVELNEYREALSYLRDVEELNESIKAVSDTIGARRSMLHECVKLFIYNYTQNKDIMPSELSTDMKEQKIIDSRSSG